MSTEMLANFDIEVDGREMRVDVNDALRLRLLDYFAKEFDRVSAQADADLDREELTKTINGLRIDSPVLFVPRLIMSGILSIAGFRVMSGALNIPGFRFMPIDWATSWGEREVTPLDDNDRMCDVFLNIKIDGRSMSIDLNNAICFRLIDFCHDEIRRAVEDGDLDEHMEEMVQVIRGLKADPPKLPHPRQLMAGIMSIAGFRLVSVDWVADWKSPQAHLLIAHEGERMNGADGLYEEEK